MVHPFLFLLVKLQLLAVSISLAVRNHLLDTSILFIHPWQPLPSFMQDKRECVKTINTCIERVLDSLVDILALLKVGNGTKIEEITSLVLAKKKMSELTENLQRIFQNLVYLKLIHRNLNISYEQEPGVGSVSKPCMFSEYFEEMSRGFQQH